VSCELWVMSWVVSTEIEHAFASQPYLERCPPNRYLTFIAGLRSRPTSQRS